MSAKTRCHTDYSVGWVCALPHEQTAAIAMLDERHDNLSKPSADTNAYTLGSIGHHNIVIACLPKGHVGPNTAATVATQMVQTFPSIKVGLMVGIGGGMPPKVRLGDVVVSTPNGQFPGVVQWDLGKSTEGGNFERTGSLNNPPNSLLSALGKLESKHELEGSKIPVFLEQFGEAYPLAAKNYLKSTSLKDVLFKSAYLHVHRKSTEDGSVDSIMDGDGDDESDDDEEEPGCISCDKSQVVKRKPQARPMRIHYGLIASSITVIEDAEFRDKLNKELDKKVLCLEMEAAGLMNSFPCIVIRGICDYADSHKNKTWQRHSAAVAAAFAKELLGCVQSSDVEGERLIRNILKDVKDELSHITQNIKTGFGDTKKGLDNLIKVHNVQKQNEVLAWLSSIDSASLHHDYVQKCEPGTGQTLLASEEFQRWLNTPKTTLFCTGIPGAGKTFQTAILIDHLVKKFRNDDTVGLAFFYYRFDRQDSQMPEQIIANLIKQLAQNHEPSLKKVRELRKGHEKRHSRPLFNDLVTLLRDIIPLLSRAYVIIDALDECDDNDNSRTKLLNSLFDAQDIGLNIYATSRKIDVIEQKFEGSLTRQITPSQHDIFTLLDTRMSQLPSFVQSNVSLQDEIKESIQSAIEGMFLLAQLYIDSLIGKRSVASVRKSLAELKKSDKRANDRSVVLSEAYNKAMGRISQQKGDLSKDAMIILAWVLKSKTPLTIEQLQLLLAIDAEASIIDKDNFPSADHITQACAPLVVIESSTQTARLVHYTIQEYFEEPGNIWMENSQEIIARTCMSYLSFSKIQSVFGWNKFKYGNSEGFFHTYATKFWAHHAVEASVQGLEVQEMVEFLDNNGKSELWHDSLMQIELARNGFFKTAENPLRASEQVVALHVAACFGLSDVVAVLVSKGCNPDARDKRQRSPLWWAAYNGHTAVVECLLQRNVDIEAKDNLYYTTPLKLAVERGSAPIVKLLLENGADVESGNCDELLCLVRSSIANGSKVKVYKRPRWTQHFTTQQSKMYLRCLTPLASAAIRGYDDILSLLLARGAKIETESGFDSTTSALHVASQGGWSSTVKVLLANGADMNFQDNEGLTALHTAAKFDRLDAVKILLNRGADPSIRDSKGFTALHTAANFDRTSIVELLLANDAYSNQLSTVELSVYTGAVAKIHKGSTALPTATNLNSRNAIEVPLIHGANVDDEDKEGFTALHLAASLNHYNAVKALLTHGADIEAQNYNGMTALRIAIASGHHSTVKILLTHGANKEALNQDGSTALHMAIQSGYPGIVEILLTHGANTEAQNRNGLTALHMAKRSGHYDIVEILLTHGANTEAQNRNGSTALQIAVSSHHDIVGTLITHGAKIEAQNHDCITTLHMAARFCGSRTVGMLLANGAGNKDVQDKEGWTALRIAAGFDNWSVVEALLKHGADIKAKNENGETSLILASKHGSLETANALIARGADMAADYCSGQSVLSWAIASSLRSTVELLIANGLTIKPGATIAGGPILHCVIEKKDALLLLDWLLKYSVDVNYRDGSYESTLLHKAVATGCAAIVSRLLGIDGINAEAVDARRRDALTMAIRSRKKEIAKILMDPGKVRTVLGSVEFFEFLTKSYR